MKDFDKLPEQTGKALAAEQRNHIQETLMAQVKNTPGLTVFEFDLSTGLIEAAKIQKVSMTIAGEKRGHLKVPATLHKKIIQRDQCLYCAALNKENALKKFCVQYEELVKSGHIQRPDPQQKDYPAFEKWLIENYKEQGAIAYIIFQMLEKNPSAGNMVWAYLEQTGDIEYTHHTFMKAAGNILAKHNIKPHLLN